MAKRRYRLSFGIATYRTGVLPNLEGEINKRGEDRHCSSNLTYCSNGLPVHLDT